MKQHHELQELRIMSLTPHFRISIAVAICSMAILGPSGSAQRMTGDFIAGENFASTGSFSWYGVARPASGQVSTDLNGDGKADFVVWGYTSDPVTNQASPAVYSLLNNGDGTFRTIKARPINSPAEMVLADLDGDGKLDLVCALWLNVEPNPIPPVAEVSFGNGDGTFGATTTYNLGEHTTRLDVADVNGDGMPDQVFATSQGTLVFPNGGNRTFKNPILFNPGISIFSFVLADVNGDRRADLIVSDGGSQVAIALGEAAGSFKSPNVYTTSAFPRRPVVGDLNGDGLMDIVVPSFNGVDILLGNGNGSFHRGSWPFSASGTSAALADFNRDGNLDLVLVNEGMGNGEGNYPFLRVYPGRGDGTFATTRMYNTPYGQNIIFLLDVNHDGAPDVVMSDLSVLLGDGYGSLRGAPITRSPEATGIVSGDFNGDGKPDAVVANAPECQGAGKLCPLTVTMLLGTGNDWLQAPKTYATGLLERGNQLVGMAVGDVNGDGHLDLVIKNPLDPSLSLLLGNGDGTLRSPLIVHAPIGNDGYPGSFSIFLVDVNHDHKLDIVVNSGVLLGRGDGTFGSLIPFPAFPAPGFQRMAVADLNGDGNLDIAASMWSQPNPYNSPIYSIAILFGDGQGNFQTESEWQTHSYEFVEGAADMNGDSRPDLILGGVGISVLLNKGNGTFSPSSTMYARGYGEPVLVGDFTSDGINDVVATHSYDMLLLKGKGDGTLQPNGAPVPAVARWATATDLDRDGALDVLVANSLGVTRLMNFGPPTVTPASLVWQSVRMGNSGDLKVVAVRNYNNKNLILRELIVGPNARDFTIRSMTCGGQLHLAATCSISVAFAPKASGARSALLQITDNFGNVQQVSLAGTGML